MTSSQANEYAREPLLLAQNDEELSEVQEYRSEKSSIIARHQFARRAFDYDWKASLHRTPIWLRHILRSRTRAFFYALVPQLIRRKYFKEPGSTASKIHATAWMDGIRGLAAVCVFTKHYLARYTTTIFRGYGTTSADYHLHQLPFFNLFYDGWSGLILFFVIGGYVCSYKPLQAIANGDNAAFVRSLSLSIFRRWFRLYLPLLCYTAAHCALAYLGAYEPAHFVFEFEDASKVFPGRPIPGYRPRFGLFQQFSYWVTASSETMNFWTERPSTPRIGAHLWAILEMFRGSMHLYVILVALAICKPWARIFVLLVVSYIYVAFLQHWEPITFFLGAVLAQIDIMRLRREKESDANTILPLATALDDAEAQMLMPSNSVSVRFRLLSFFHHGRRFTTPLRTVLYFLALYLLGFGQVGARYPGILYKDMINPLIPSFFNEENGHIFPKTIGVSLLMYLLSTVPMKDRARSIWHRILTLPFCQYLGSVMFPLYLLHPMMLRLFGYALPALFWRRWDNEIGEWHYEVPQDTIQYLAGVFLGWAATFIILLWTSDIWTREVDARCMRLTTLIETWLCMKK